MSGAAAPSSPGQSASQLSENIVDVLASIRRLIAQDEAADAGAPPSDAQPCMSHAESGSSGPDQWRPAADADPASAQPGILAATRGLIRRNPPESVGVDALPAPLQLGAAERICGPLPDPATATTAEPRILAAQRVVLPPLLAMPARATDHSRPPFPDPAEERAAAPESLSLPAVDPAMASAAQPAVMLMAVASPAGKAGVDCRSEDDVACGIRNPSEIMQFAALSGPDSPAADTPGPGIARSAAAASFPNASDIVRMPENHPIDRTEHAMMHDACMTAVSAEPNPSRAGDTIAPLSTPRARDDSSDTIFREMIRDIIRQELQSDRSNGLSGDLRTMILHEVALALTGKRSAP